MENNENTQLPRVPGVGCIDFANFTPAPCGSELPMEDKGIFIVKEANEWSEQAAKRPNPKSLWHNLWFADEVGCLFADTNVGKSILAVQLAEEIGSQYKVLYFDFELTDKQFQRRYTNEETGKRHIFPSNFLRVELNPEAFVDDDITVILDQIEMVAKKENAKILIIDNITWLTSKSESGDAAAQLMSRLIQMKKRGGYSILVLAHTPKRNTNAPLNQNSLAGSKRLANFMDSIFAIGVSKKDGPGGRYIKQIKVRSCEMEYGEDNVIETKLIKEDDFLQMVITGYGTEADNLEKPDEQDILRGEADEEIARRIGEGESYRSIANEMGVSTKKVWTINNILKKRQGNN